MRKKHFFSNHAKSSAMIVSLLIHGVLIAIAITLVVASVMPREEIPFVPKKVVRPKMPPRPIKVPIDTKRRKPQPKLRQRIVSERKTLADIQMPKVSGVKGGLGNMGGTGNWNLGFDIKIDLFGSNKSMGNEFVGTFYDLKQTSDGEPVEMSNDIYIRELGQFASGWKQHVLDRYFKAPQEKYATFFMIPKMNAGAAPKAYGVEGVVEPKHWAAYYRGYIAAPETGHYRFCGYGDDVLLVRINRRLVLDACHAAFAGRVTSWKSKDANSRKFPMGRDHLIIGDWFKLAKGESVEMDVFFGECPGGGFACQLMIEQRGKEYKQVPFDTPHLGSGIRPVLPVFKTKEIPKELHEQMRINPDEVTLDGPTFGVME